MRIARVELRRVRIPFKRRFDHATAARDSAERIYVTLQSDGGHVGFGEIMPRPYLTGETLEEIFGASGPARAAELIGRPFANQAALVEHLRLALGKAGRRLALVGGFEAALINMAEAAFGSFDYGTILGPMRTTPIGRCVTIGLVDCQRTLRRYALEAKMAKATVVKVKVSGEQDVDRIKRLRDFLGATPMRLDANGGLSFEAARALLTELSDEVCSIEQPLDAAEPDLADKLSALFGAHGVPIMADESACSAADIDAFGSNGSYQLVNIRAGKCGGLLGAQAAIEAARRHCLGIVGGTLVGESGVLDRYGGILLMRSDDMPYMEGLGQPHWLLEGDPTAVSENKSDPQCYERKNRFKWNDNLLKRWQVDDVAIFS